MPQPIHPYSHPFSPSLALAISPSDILDFHRLTFGALRMEDTDDDGGDKGAENDTPDPGKGKGGEQDKDKPLGPNGEKALNAEREARKKAEDGLKELKAQMETMTGAFKSALGLEDDKGSDAAEIAAKLQDRLDGLERSNLVERVARAHKITSDDDIDFLRSAKDEEAMVALAKRLAPSNEDTGSGDSRGKSRIPRPDPNQGKGSGDSGSRATSVSQVMADRRAAREKAKQ